MRRANRDKGYTIVELLVGVGILSMATAIAVPALTELRTMYQVRATADSIAGEISKARMRSVGQGVISRVRILDSTYVVETSEDGTTFQAVEGPFTVPEGLSLAITGQSPRFGRTGIAPNPVTISIGQNQMQRTLHMNVLGRVTSS